jgi:Flp pilus assembly protein TadD
MKLSPIFGACLAFAVAACGGGDSYIAPKGDSYSSAVQQADSARLAGDLDSALPLYGRALQANPDGTEAKLGLGQAYLSLGAGDEAAAQFRDVLARHSGDSAARRGLAAALIAQGQPTLAEKQAEMALQLDDHDYRALNVMGVSLDMQGRNVEAQARYRQGIALAPDFLPLRSNLALSLAITGQPQEAIALLVPIVSGRKADGRMRQNLAFAYAMAGDPQNALLVSRRDLDEASAERQLSYFLQLKALPPEARSAQLRQDPNFFPRSGRGV